MTLTEEITKNIIRLLINAQDYRIEILNLITIRFQRSVFSDRKTIFQIA
jgi:hypothetical protein